MPRDTDKAGALRVAESVRTAIAAINVPGVDRPITASIGVAILPDDGGDAVTLFRSADRALYAAKNAGRNRIETADGDMSSDPERDGGAPVRPTEEVPA